MSKLCNTIGELRAMLADLPDDTPVTTSRENSSDSDTWITIEDGIYVSIEPERTSVHLSAREYD